MVEREWKGDEGDGGSSEPLRHPRHKILTLVLLCSPHQSSFIFVLWSTHATQY